MLGEWPLRPLGKVDGKALSVDRRVDNGTRDRRNRCACRPVGAEVVETGCFSGMGTAILGRWGQSCAAAACKDRAWRQRCGMWRRRARIKNRNTRRRAGRSLLWRYLAWGAPSIEGVSARGSFGRGSENGRLTIKRYIFLNRSTPGKTIKTKSFAVKNAIAKTR